MYIVISISIATGMQMYYTGYVSEVAPQQYRVQNKWDMYNDYATCFSTELLALRVAKTFQAQANNDVIYQVRLANS